MIVNNTTVANESNCTISDRPILFSTPMVQAILDGKKTATRRIIKDAHPQATRFEIDINHRKRLWSQYGEDGLLPGKHLKCSYGGKGDRLWVREAWLQQDDGTYCYKVDKENEDIRKMYGYKWKPSIHMPRKACRLVLEVKNIRVERLQDISEEDAIAEGITLIKDQSGINRYTIAIDNASYNAPIAKEVFAMLWAHINGWDSWEANPFVWVVEFERIEVV